ncbi:MAG: hypothetical protein H8E71_04670 [Candidatus Marinimicrobia bacterium]|nr:hypothetical protein [Candidatus Neomarinimicrobiota bacterium]MBL7109666.1 hypothetical protein [Candidatus Neomarinimicrobiota bacterium]
MFLKRLLVCILVTVCFSEDHFDEWVNTYLAQSDSGGLEIELSHWFITPIDTSEAHGRLIVSQDKKFRFEMGYKTIVSDGVVWKTYDERSNRLITQFPDTTFENTILVWFDKEKLLGVKRENINSKWDFRLSFSNKIPDAEIHFSPKDGSLIWIDVLDKEYIQRLYDITIKQYSGDIEVFQLEIPGAFEIDLRE